MTNNKRNQGLAWGALASLSLISLSWIKGLFGGESLIKGIGNSGNHFHFDPISNKLPALIAESKNAPTITDEQLAETFEAVLARARQGDLEAAIVVFKVAEIQQQKNQHES